MNTISTIQRTSKNIPTLTQGFTLIELFLVITIIGVIAAILIPVVSNVIETTNTSRDVSNSRQVTLAILLYSYENNGAVPERGQGGNIDGWIEKLREYNPSLEQRGQFEAYMDKVIRTDPEKERRSFAINRGIINNFNYGEKSFKIPVNPSKTILLANRCTASSIIPGDPGTWSSGSMETFGSDSVSKLYDNGKAYLLGYMDGHVNIITFKSSEQYWGSPWHNVHWLGQ